MKNTYTYIDALNEVLTIDTLSDQCKEKLEALRDQQVKRNSAKSNKPTKTQVENEGVKNAIKEFLRDNPNTRCGDIANAVSVSGQKASALLSQLVKSGEVIKAEGEKRVTIFRLA